MANDFYSTAYSNFFLVALVPVMFLVGLEMRGAIEAAIELLGEPVVGRSNGELFREWESEVRSYCRNFPSIFVGASGARLRDETGAEYIDFLSGAGALNYGHNNPAIKAALLAYLNSDGVIQSLDLHTAAKAEFIEAFRDVILAPRDLKYRLAFTGPTGTNAVEAALKFARAATGRQNVIAFTHAFHGMSLGALAASATRKKRDGAGIPLGNVTRLPYDGYLGADIDTAELLERLLDDPGSGVDLPAAIILETVQAEGGLAVASEAWIKRVQACAARHEVVLIIDDIQAGCGRTGSFFSFEPLGIKPDIVCLSKSLGGIGLPISLVLVRPEFDVLLPGQHNGTFRGNNLAFVTGRAALDLWRDPEFERSVKAVANHISRRLHDLAETHADYGTIVKGRGLLVGLSWKDPQIAGRVSKEAFARGLIVETSGARNEVLKLLPPLTISDGELELGLARLEASVLAALEQHTSLRRSLDDTLPNAAE